jgi:hypothetical protein
MKNKKLGQSALALKWRHMWDFLKFNNPAHLTLFDLLAKGHPGQQKNALLSLLKVIFAIYALTLLVAIIALTVILPRSGFVSYLQQGQIQFASVLFLTLISYAVSAALTVLFWHWKHFSQGAKYSNTLYMADLYISDPEQRLYSRVTISYIFRLGLCIESPIVLAFLVGILGGGYWVIPLIIQAAILLVLVFPTNDRLLSWLNEQRNG